MKSSMTTSVTQWNAYLSSEIPSRFLRHGTGYDHKKAIIIT
ncbi:hypothetical protein [Algoriphagus persicinus]|nr:hypothetical protein [Algoriphagus sp. E1-3-M2]MEB2784513.1 hypothetical protein [Algoriphagus sp. E1-3-M2]